MKIMILIMAITTKIIMIIMEMMMMMMNSVYLEKKIKLKKIKWIKKMK